jgi:nucleoside-diphosphate-sugar epimerase
MNIDNAKKILGYSPKFSLKEGLKETWSWYIKHSSQTVKRHNYFK